jgi:hypothetical protein
MKTRLTFLAILSALLIFAACNSNPGLKTNNDKTGQTDTNVADKSGENQSSNFELLQGKWQSTDDKTNFLVFDKNRRKEIAEGMQSWDDEEFILTDQCENESNKADNNSKEKDRYISCKKSDLCWYIVSISTERLTLQYMGRGNTLTYTRVKK